MPSPLSEEEIEAQRKAKLDYEKLRLLRDYDDSSDEDDELDYKNKPGTTNSQARNIMSVQ